MSPSRKQMTFISEWFKDILLMMCVWEKESTKFSTTFLGSSNRVPDVLRLRGMRKELGTWTQKEKVVRRPSWESSDLWLKYTDHLRWRISRKPEEEIFRFHSAFLVQSPNEAPCWLILAAGQREGSHRCSSCKSGAWRRKRDGDEKRVSSKRK